MKKVSFSILLATSLSLVGTRALAYDIAVENADGVTIWYNYINNGTELEVTNRSANFNSYRGVVIIPDEVIYMNVTRKVTSIGDYAFSNYTSLSSVTIPSSVTSIGSGAFDGCIGLTSVHISDLESWCKIAFHYSSSNPLNYAHHLFQNGEEIKNLVIPNSVKTISEWAFCGCSGLTSVTIPNVVTSIGRCVFYGCSGLTSVTIEDGVTSIGSSAFYNCTNLTSITIPNSITSIGEEAFTACESLTSITIPNSVKAISEWAFSYCSGLTSVTIPQSVTTIGNSAFINCTSLTSVAIEDGVTSIGEGAFSGCTSLTSVTIPGSVTSIENTTFKDCCGLASVTIEDGVTSIGVDAFCFCSDLTSVSIPTSVTSIGAGAFYGCTSLTSITIPSNVTYIGANAFDGCDLPEVVSKIENPFAIDPSTYSDNTFYNATLYVPAGTIDAYKATEGWQKFAFIEEENGGDTPEPQKCATPTITFVNGKVRFACETEGVEFVPSVTSTPQQELNGNEMELGTTFTVSVYAVKEGYDNSDVATKTIELSHVGDVNADGEVNVSDVTSLVSIILGSGNN